MQGRRSRFSFVLVTLLLVAGCLSLAGGGQEAPDDALAFPHEAFHETVWANGTFTAQQSYTGAAGASNEDFRLIPFPEDLPEQAPVRMVAHLNYTAPSTDQPAASDLDIFVASGGIYERDPVYRETREEGPASERDVATFADFPDQPVQLGLIARGLQEGQERDYTLRITLTAIPTIVPAGTPVAVDVPESAASIQLGPVQNDKPVGAMAWDPQDAFLGWHRGDATQAAQIPIQGLGEYVVAPDAPAHVRILGADGEPVPGNRTLRVLNTTLLESEPRALPQDGGPESWSFETDRVPLTPAARVQPGGGPAGAMVVSGITIEIRSEHGPVTTQSTNCPSCVLTGDLVYPGPNAHENVDGSSFEVTARYNGSTNADLVPLGLTYQR